jgi:DNA polymerase-1
MNYETLIIDGPYLAHRSYDAPYRLTTKDGRDSTMIHSFIRSLNAFRKQFNPKTIIIAWESPGTPSWRRHQYPAYKGTRGRLDEQFIYQLNDLQNLLHLFGVKQYNSPCNEADDVIARLSIDNIKYPVVVFTKDKDIMQLVGEQLQIYDGKELYDINKVKEKFFVWPEQIPDLLAIAGDKSDNIEGLEGFGFKKAAKIIEEIGDIEHLNMLTCSRNLVYSEQTKNMLMQNKKLTELNFDCTLQTIPKEIVKDTIESIMDKYELKKMKESIEEYKLLGGK